MNTNYYIAIFLETSVHDGHHCCRFSLTACMFLQLKAFSSFVQLVQLLYCTNYTDFSRHMNGTVRRGDNDELGTGNGRQMKFLGFGDELGSVFEISGE